MGFQAALELLHRNGADLNGIYRNYRPLHNLIQSEPHARGNAPTPERLACLDWMLNHGADPERLGAWPSARAVIVSAFAGRPEYVKHLLQAGARVDGFTASALGERKVVEGAIRDRPGFSRERDSGVLTALQCAAGSRLPDADILTIARLLLDAGADPNARTKSWAQAVTPAYFACGNIQMFALLLDRGADPTEALSHAVWGKHYDLAEMALGHGADVDRATANGKPLLNDLIRWGQIPQSLWMLDHSASPNVPDKDGWTAVHQAASRGNVKLMRAVLDAGGNSERRDQKGWTPRDLANIAGRQKLLPLMTAGV
jgi:ankyrin repeat protein